MKSNFIAKTGVFLILLLLLIIRIFLDDKHSKWIQYIGFIGVIVALIGLYKNLYDRYYHIDKFKVISGLAIIITFIVVLIGAGMITNLIMLDGKCNDCLTILALLISLPSDLYYEWVGKYLNK